MQTNDLVLPTKEEAKTNMAKFTKNNQPDGRGRKVGSKNKRALLGDELVGDALDQVRVAVTNGEQWAVQLIMKMSYPQLKPITHDDSLDGELIEAKIEELSNMKEFKELLELLKAQVNDN